MARLLMHYLQGSAWMSGRGLASAPRSVFVEPRGTITQGYRTCIALNSHYDYDEVRSEFQTLKPAEHFNFAKDIVGSWAKKKPGHPALHFTNGHDSIMMTYHDLYQQAQALATALIDQGPPRCALVILPKVPEWWIINVAGSWCGTMISPGTTLLTLSDIAYRLSKCGADCIICDADMATALDSVTCSLPLRIAVTRNNQEIRHNWVSYHHLLESVKGKPVKPCIVSRGDDIAQLFFTSGTTGMPKIVPHTQSSYGLGLLTAARYWLDLKEDDLIWNISDTGWAKAAWSSLYAPFMCGATGFIHQMSRFDPEETLRSLCEYPVTVLCAPPTAYRAMIQFNLSQYRFQSLRHCVSAGEPLNPEAIEIWTRNTGYLFSEERTDEAFVGDYYLTGDKAYYDDDGYFWFIGRADDVILSGGYRIGPFEVESSLLEHPAVTESAVVSSPDSQRGEVVKAFIVLASDYENHDPKSLVAVLQEHVKKSSAPYKYPRKIEFVKSLPKTVSGKIRRVELRDQEWGRK
ncbi:acyl-coenzyme A synthetase ACSM3, mitochondrial-like isoform X3 [Panulirus ornatus]|uniref:acyl-coenzyme A synthetase ACSM3, mitochondrial-like isoform X3 n=1 Tax=Panulirus ornatus TaxID=150431 RepID=UPI003A8413E8